MVLIVTAAWLGFFHTLIGPDHYLPFIVIAKARKWPIFKTVGLTFLCGVGHVASSVVLGLAGISLGIAVKKLEIIESFRGNIAAWGLIAFGLLYFAWGLRRAIRNKPHKHLHAHNDSEEHLHTHTHHQEHLHVHAEDGQLNLTPWILFTIFVFGPCEPLIPLVMYPAVGGSIWGAFWVAVVFSITTITTMLAIVVASSLGLNFLPLGKLERYSHALAGATIFLSGLAIQFLGL